MKSLSRILSETLLKNNTTREILDRVGVADDLCRILVDAYNAGELTGTPMTRIDHDRIINDTDFLDIVKVEGNHISVLNSTDSTVNTLFSHTTASCLIKIHETLGINKITYKNLPSVCLRADSKLPKKIELNIPEGTLIIIAISPASKSALSGLVVSANKVFIDNRIKMSGCDITTDTLYVVSGNDKLNSDSVKFGPNAISASRIKLDVDTVFDAELLLDLGFLERRGKKYSVGLFGAEKHKKIKFDPLTFSSLMHVKFTNIPSQILINIPSISRCATTFGVLQLGFTSKNGGSPGFGNPIKTGTEIPDNIDGWRWGIYQLNH